MEVRHHAGSARPKDWKLLCDPTINPAYSTKVFRCDGPTSGRSPDRPRDPRTPRMHSWTSRRESANLPLPKFVYDEYYVGDPIEKEVTFDNLNDNITPKNLLDMCKTFGVVEDPKVYFHPKTKKHLGIGKVVFRSSRAANECAQKLNNTSKMGNIMIVKVDPMGKERHALIQARIGSSRRHGDTSQHGPQPGRPGETFAGPAGHAGASGSAASGASGSSSQFHPSIPPSHPLHPRSQEFAQRPPQPHGAYPPPPPPSHGGHEGSGGFIEEVVSRPHHESSSGHHGPPPSSHHHHHHRSSHHQQHPHSHQAWSASKGEHSGQSGGRRRRGSDQRSPPEQSLPPPPAPGDPATVVVNHSAPIPMETNLSSAANSSAEGGVLETSDSLAAAPSRRDSSISNESGATGTSAGLLQDSLAGLAGGSGGAIASNDAESLESRIQKLLKGTSLSGPTSLNALAPSPIAGSATAPGRAGFMGLPPPGTLPNAAGTPLSEEEAMRSGESRCSGSPQQPNTPPSPPSPYHLDPMALAAGAGRPLLGPPAGVAAQLPPASLQSQLASRRTLLPTPPVGLLPTPAAGLPDLPPPSVLPNVAPPPAPAPWPEACSDTVLTEVLKLLVDELKEVMKRDVSKRMTESCAFPVFNRWWANQEKRSGGGGGLYPSQASSLSPTKRLDGLSRRGVLSPGASNFSRLDNFPPSSASLPSSLASSSATGATTLPSLAGGGAVSGIGANGVSSTLAASSGTATESEVNLGGGQNATVANESSGTGVGGTQQTTSGFAALFESLKEGGGGMSFFKGIRGALPKIKRKPRAPTPPREKTSGAEKHDASRRTEAGPGSGANASVGKADVSPRKENGPLQRPGSPPSSDDARRRRKSDLDGDDSDSTSPAVASSDDEPMEEDEGEEEEEEEDSSAGSSSSSSSEEEEDEDEEEAEIASSSDLSEADAARQRELLERQQARLIRQLDKLEGRSSHTAAKPARGRPPKAPVPATPATKSATRNKRKPSAKNDAASVSSISTLSSSGNESPGERAPAPAPAPAPVPAKNKNKKTPAKKTPEKKRENNSLFDVFNTLLEGKQKTSTTLATPQTLNRRIVDEKEAIMHERESDRSSEEEEEEEGEEEKEEEEREEELRRPVAPPPSRSRARAPPPKRPVGRKVERSPSIASSSSASESEEEEEEDESESGSSDEEGSMAGDSQWSDRVPEPSPSRRRRKQDLFSPATIETPPMQKTPSTPGAGPATLTTASQRLRQLKKGETLSPLPPTPSMDASSPADSVDDDGSDAEEDLSWLPDVGESYEWPWTVQHDHSYCFEPNAEAMQLRPLNQLAEQLLELHRQRSTRRKRPAIADGEAGPPKKRSMQDITNKHRDRTSRGSRELASLFTPVEAKSLTRDRHRKKLAPPRPRRRFKARDMVAEQDILFDIFVRGIDEEDVRFLHLCYQRLLDEDNTGTSWVNDTHWVEHPVTFTSESSPSQSPDRQDRVHNNRARARQLRLSPAPAHSSGSCRTESFYRLTRAEKCSLALSAAAVGAGHCPRGGDFPTNMSAANSAAAGGITDENASKKAKVREMRSEQRRLLAEFQDVETGDLLKFNQLKFRKKQLQFDRSGIHSWGLFAMETIAAEEMVIEYVGQMIRKNVAEVREKKYEASGIGSSYLFRVDDEYVIDATMCGNFARFINHSCNPNCYAKVITVESAKKIVIYSKREILKFEEITYDYKFPYEEEKIPCLCGSTSCRGTLN